MSSSFPKLSSQMQSDLLQICKTLADKTRLQILALLAQEGEMNVSALCDAIGQSQPAISHHLAVMRLSGVIKQRRDGKNNFYSVFNERFSVILGRLFEANGQPREAIRFDRYVLVCVDAAPEGEA